MKICFYCDSIFTFGGVQRVLAVLAKSLSKNHDITILTLDDPSLYDVTMYGLDSVNIHYINLQYSKIPIYENIPCKAYSLLYKTILPQNKLFTRWYGYSSFSHTKRSLLIKTLNKGQYDIVVGVHIFLAFHLASIKNSIHAKTIGWMHSSYDAFFNIKTPYIGKQKKQFAYEMPKLNNIVVLTERDKKLYKEKVNIDAKVIYNPLTIIPRGKGSPSFKKFLAVGRFAHSTKGFDILIEAFALFAQKNTDWTLDIVGEGPEEDMLRSLINKNNLEKRVTIYPFTKDIEKHYSSASVYILSSRWEGFPLVLFEAMSYALPIISSDIPVAKEILENKGVAVLFQNQNIENLAKKMIEVAEQTDLIKMGEAAFNYSQTNTVEHITKQWEQLIS